MFWIRWVHEGQHRKSDEDDRKSYQNVRAYRNVLVPIRLCHPANSSKPRRFCDFGMIYENHGSVPLNGGVEQRKALDITWCTRVKIAVAAPIPRVRVMTAVVVTPGVFRSCRNASRKSISTGAPHPVRDIRRSLWQYRSLVVREYAGYSSQGRSHSSPMGAAIFDRSLTSGDLGGHSVGGVQAMADRQHRRNYL